MATVLLTGFEAFGNTPINPAESVTRLLDGTGGVFLDRNSVSIHSGTAQSPLRYSLSEITTKQYRSRHFTAQEALAPTHRSWT